MDKEKKYVKQYDKRIGVTYIYENRSYWDKEKKQPRSERKYVGRLCEKTGEIIATHGKGRKPKSKQTEEATESTPIQPIAKRCFYGATYLLDEIGKKFGITEDLQYIFPDRYKQILSTVYFLISEANSAMYRFEKWGYLHKHPYGKDISSQRSSDLFASITEDEKIKFFKLQGRRREENEYWAYDITSISSYSELLQQVHYGHNKENDKLPQLNLALVYGEESGLPFYYRKLAGNTPDSKTIKNLLADLSDIGFKKVKLVMDRGCYSEDNINELYKAKCKFLVASMTYLKFIRATIDPVYDNIHSFDNYDEDYGLYGYTVPIKWTYTQKRPHKGDTISEKKQMYVHVYYNPNKALEDEQKFNKKLAGLRKELHSGKLVEKHKKLYDDYFEERETEDGLRIISKKEAIDEVKRYYGYFVLLSNEIKDTWDALYRYRAKDVVEKAFGNIKEKLNMRRTLVSSEQSLDGKLFVQFVALIYLSYINKQMKTNKMYKDYTLHELLDKLDIIECFENEGKKLRVGEVSEKQKEIYMKMDVKIPT
jgi:transposase